MSASLSPNRLSGPRLFARYAYAPNALGYCGPADTTALVHGTDSEIRQAAQRFSGVWPYLCVLSAMTGIPDPLDPELVDSYWLGGGIGAKLESAAFLDALLRVISPIAGGYWQHLTADLVSEASADHNFHVFGVYPWTRLLRRGPAPAVQVLDNCRITWARVCSRTSDAVRVRGSQVRWDGARLSLSREHTWTVPTAAALWDGAALEAGDHVALHWNQICGLLTTEQVERVHTSTVWHLAATNRRLAGG